MVHQRKKEDPARDHSTGGEGPTEVHQDQSLFQFLQFNIRLRPYFFDFLFLQSVFIGFRIFCQDVLLAFWQKWPNKIFWPTQSQKMHFLQFSPVKLAHFCIWSPFYVLQHRAKSCKGVFSGVETRDSPSRERWSDTQESVATMSYLAESDQ